MLRAFLIVMGIIGALTYTAFVSVSFGKAVRRHESGGFWNLREIHRICLRYGLALSLFALALLGGVIAYVGPLQDAGFLAVAGVVGLGSLVMPYLSLRIWLLHVRQVQVVSGTVTVRRSYAVLWATLVLEAAVVSTFVMLVDTAFGVHEQALWVAGTAFVAVLAVSTCVTHLMTVVRWREDELTISTAGTTRRIPRAQIVRVNRTTGPLAQYLGISMLTVETVDGSVTVRWLGPGTEHIVRDFAQQS